MLRTFKDSCVKAGGAVYRFAADPRYSLWLVLVTVLTYLVWRITYGTIGALWSNLPPVAAVPVIAAAVILVQRFLPSFRWLHRLSGLALVVLVAWLALPTRVLPHWHLVALHVSFIKLVPTLLFLLTAVLGRTWFTRPSERWVLGWSKPSAKERSIALRFFDHFTLASWGPYKVSSDKWWLRLWISFNRVCAVVIMLASLAVPVVKHVSLKGITYSFTGVTNFAPPAATVVLSDDGEPICRFAIEDRQLVPLARIPKHVREAFLAAEDQNFYQHDGIDPIAIMRALRHHLATGRDDQGGSTLTQQIVKQLVLHDSSRTKIRKLREWFLAVELEKSSGVSKDKLLELYLNHIFLGRAHGIQAAARAYYGKDVSQLTIGEAAFLGGMPKEPSGFSPSMNYPRAKERQAYVLHRMAEQGFITEAQRKEALAQDVAVIVDSAPLNRTAAPYFCAFVFKQLSAQYGEQKVLKGGLVVQTTLNLKMQEAAEAAVRNGLIDLERKLGFNGPEGHDNDFKVCIPRAVSVRDNSIELGTVVAVAPAVSVCVSGETFRMYPEDQSRIEAWQRKAPKNVLKVGDTLAVKVQTFVRAKDMPKGTPEGRFATSARRTAGKGHPEALQAALLSIDPSKGFVKAMVGGYDFNENQYNSAVQGHRQTGSSVKPYIYLTALRHGMVVTDIVNDHPACYPSASGTWCPQNYLGPHTAQRYMGAVDLRTALAKSLNSISVQLLAKYGVDEGLATMRSLGINSPIPRVLPIAVGALDLTLWEHTAAYAGIAAGGKRLPSQFGNATPSIFITKVTDTDGKTLYAYEPKEMAQAVPAGSAYALIHLMKGVVEFGTGHRVKELARPAAGKTGTTNDFKDAWFMGYTADLVTGVWVGRMTPTPIAKEATGGTVALPIWLGFMEAAHPKTPAREFSVPDDVTVMMGDGGKPVPFQRGRLPAKFQAKKSE